MYHDDSFSYIATDSGLVAELLHVSPVFIRVGPRRRGVFDDRRQARLLRTDARTVHRPARARRRAADPHRVVGIVIS